MYPRYTRRLKNKWPNYVQPKMKSCANTHGFKNICFLNYKYFLFTMEFSKNTDKEIVLKEIIPIERMPRIDLSLSLSLSLVVKHMLYNFFHPCKG